MCTYKYSGPYGRVGTVAGLVGVFVFFFYCLLTSHGGGIVFQTGDNNVQAMKLYIYIRGPSFVVYKFYHMEQGERKKKERLSLSLTHSLAQMRIRTRPSVLSVASARPQKLSPKLATAPFGAVCVTLLCCSSLF